MELHFYASTDPGMCRAHNEDSYAIDNELGLVVVADGMGGKSRGEVASALVSQCVKAYIQADELNRKNGVSNQPAEIALMNAVQDANQKIIDTSRSLKTGEDMGSTVVTGLFTSSNKLVVAHVGDSRAYKFRGKLQRLTEDHSLVGEQVKLKIITEEQAFNSDQRNVILRAVGLKPDVEVDVNVFDTKEDDYYMFCSDGLTACINDAELGDVISKTLKETNSLRAVVNSLINLANQRGGPDNITVVFAKVGQINEEDESTARAHVNKKVLKYMERRKRKLWPMTIVASIMLLIILFTGYKVKKYFEKPSIKRAVKLYEIGDFENAYKEANHILVSEENADDITNVEAMLIIARANIQLSKENEGRKSYRELASYIFLKDGNLPLDIRNIMAKKEPKSLEILNEVFYEEAREILNNCEQKLETFSKYNIEDIEKELRKAKIQVEQMKKFLSEKLIEKSREIVYREYIQEFNMAADELVSIVDMQKYNLSEEIRRFEETMNYLNTSNIDEIRVSIEKSKKHIENFKFIEAQEEFNKAKGLVDK